MRTGRPVNVGKVDFGRMEQGNLGKDKAEASQGVEERREIDPSTNRLSGH